MTKSTAAKGTPSKKARWFIGFGVSLSAMAMAFFITLLFGRVSGLEFSPDNFETRTFYYWEIPLLGIQVSPIHRNVFSHDLQKHLESSKMITVNTKEAELIWHLAEVTRGSSQNRNDSALLCNYFGVTNSVAEDYWLIWTKKHESSARVLWPAIQEAAKYHLYIFIPEMFALAKTTENANEFKTKLDALLAEKYAFFGKAALELGQNNRAAELFELGLKRDAKNESLKRSLEAAKPKNQ